MNKPNNPKAFPMASGDLLFSEGMSLRDYFASQALATMKIPDAGEFSQNDRKAKKNERIYDWISKGCYEMADSMLKERGE